MSDRQINRWASITLGDVAWAYRKAKVDSFYERSLTVAQAFAEYEADLPRNLERLAQTIRRGNARRLLHAGALGDLSLVAKKLSILPNGEGGREAATKPAFFSDGARSFESLRATRKIVPEFRVNGEFPIDLHVLSSLWINLIGHRFDACLSSHAYGSRLRRVRSTENRTARDYHLRALGSTGSYVYPYRRWREHGLQAIEKALDAGEKIVAVTLDISNFFHRIDPKVLADRRFHAALAEGAGTSLDLTRTEAEFTTLFADALASWSRRVEEFITAHCGELSHNAVIGGIPIGLSIARVLSNVLLGPWDRLVLEHLSPIHYGRYVDDIFLVLRDPGNLRTSSDVFDLLEMRLSRRHFSTVSDGRRKIMLEGFGGDSELLLSDDKHRVFFLEGQGGRDLIRTIRREMTEIASERRLMPEPDRLTSSPAAEALTAAGDAREHPDTLRKAEGLSIRRLGWAIQLRNAETVTLDLPPKEWRQSRFEFYRFASDHVLRADRLLDHFDYFNRLLAIAVANSDWEEAREMLRAAHRALAMLEEPVSEAGRVRINGYACDADAASLWELARESLHAIARQAVLRAWPWRSAKHPAAPLEPSAAARRLLHDVGLRWRDAVGNIRLLVECDLARLPFREHLEGSAGSGAAGTRRSVALTRLLDVFGDDISTIQEFLEFVQAGRNTALGKGARRRVPAKGLIPFLFPTRPYTPREIADRCPPCVGIGKAPTGETPSELWRRFTSALRGVWTLPDSGEDDGGTESPDESDSRSAVPPDGNPPVIKVGRNHRPRRPLVAVSNFAVEEASWGHAASGDPDLSLERYRRLGELVNIALRTRPAPGYLLIPELAVPRRWEQSVLNRLLGAGINVVMGVEYRHIGRSRVRNEAVLALIDDRLGYPASVLIRQAKESPAQHEEEELLRLFNKRFEAQPPGSRIVYRHQGLDLGLLLCSELQDIDRRALFRGEVDALFVLSWNRDLETFSALVESTALDVHCYVALANNRIYGDSRVRSPAREAFRRDLCRVRGGENDYVVVVRLEVSALRRFQSRARSWPRSGDTFKPVPKGFEITPRRWLTPS